MKRYITPSFYSVDVQTENVATWGSIRFNDESTDSYDDTAEEMNMGDQTDSFDAPSYRSNLWGNN